MARDTLVEGDPAAVRTVAGWLRDGLAGGAGDLADTTFRLRSRAGSAWSSQAGDAFAGELGELGTAVDDLAGAADAVAGGVDVLAQALASAQAEMARARGVAADGGLAVTGTVIHEPGPPPPDVPALPAGAPPAQVAAYDRGVAAIAAHDRQVAAWDEAVAVADRADRDWQQAVADLSATWDRQHGSIVSLLSSLFSGGTGVAAQVAVSRWYADAAAAHRQQAGVWRSIRDSYVRDGRFVGADPEDFYRAGRTVDDLERAAAQAADDARYGASRLGTNVSRGVFALGVLATGWGIYDDVQHGESAVQAAASNGGGFVAGALAGAGTGAATGALIGSVVPGAGTAVGAVVGTVVGAGVGVITSGAIDSMFENGVDGLGDVGEALGDGWQELEDTVGGIGSMASDGVSAAGDALSGAWDSVFG